MEYLLKKNIYLHKLCKIYFFEKIIYNKFVKKLDFNFI